jgi:DNA modification methylase
MNTDTPQPDDREAKSSRGRSTSPLQVESWPLARLIPYARNARTHSPEQVAQIAASIREFGFNNPILADLAGGIIAGHGRVLAARQLGLAQAPVIVLGHLNENQKRAFMLADNQLALNAGWDLEMLRLELDALAEQNFPLELTGFPPSELEELLEQEARQALQDPDEAPSPPAQPVTRPGEIWQLGEHRLLCGDGTKREDLARLLEGKRCNLVFTDLPYNVDYQGKTAQRLKLANDNLGDEFELFLRSACTAMLAACAGPLYLCMSSSELHRLYAAFTRAGGHWSTYVIWAKNVFTLGRSDYQRQYEPILYGWTEGAQHFWCGARDQGDVWFFDKPHRNDVHPTMKPVALMEQALANSSRIGDVVLDPFAGSGSTLIACENLKRRARVVEIEPGYADVIVRRWQNYTGQSALLLPPGRRFEEVATERLAGDKP